jgi:hypothetical protein
MPDIDVQIAAIHDPPRRIERGAEIVSYIRCCIGRHAQPSAIEYILDFVNMPSNGLCQIDSLIAVGSKRFERLLPDFPNMSNRSISRGAAIHVFELQFERGFAGTRIFGGGPDCKLGG